MASTITLTVKVNKDDLNNLETRIKKINSTPIEIKATIPKDLKKFAANLAEVSRNLSHVTTNMKQTNREARSLAKENTRLAQTNKEVVKSENQVKEAEQRRITSENNLKAAAERRASAEATANAKTYAAQQKTRQEQEKTQRELLKTERAVERVSSAWQRMFSAFSVSNIISSSVTMAISRMRQAFREALDEMKQLDTALSHYRQVTGAKEAEANALGMQSYSTASKYGTSAAEYTESVATYARAGYAEMSDELAELSLKTVIVGQTTQEIADQFLLTMDAAYGYKGSVEELSKVLDGASAIDSHYATTIEKIASGLGLVAPLAAQVHVSEEELTAAIGTITAATQRSGAESARALRSLFLNIIGDTTTEIEDGVTATEESVKDMQFVLEHYAKSAVDAARATGQVVDPMEAIGALAKSMDEGLLNEAELMDLLSSLGGKLRVSQLVALVTHWKDYTNMIDTYQNSMGSANEKVATYLDSWEAKTNVLKNTWTEFIANSLSTPTLKNIISDITILLKSLGSLGNGLKVIAAAITAIKLAKFASGLRSVALASNASAQSIAKRIAQLRWEKAEADQAGNAELAFSKKMQISSSTTEFDTAVKKANAAATKALAATIAGVLVAAIATAVTAYNAYRESQKQAAIKSAEEAEEVAKAQVDSAKKAEEAYKIYYSAKDAYDKGTVGAQEYEKAVRSLAEALGIEETAIASSKDALKEKTLQEIQSAMSETQSALFGYQAAFRQEAGKFHNPFKAPDAILQAYNGYQYNDQVGEYVPTVNHADAEEEKKALDAVAEAYRGLIKERDEAAEREDWETYSEASAVIQKYSDTLGKVVEQEDLYIQQGEELLRITTDAIEGVSTDGLSDGLNQATDDLDETGKAAEEATEKFAGLSKAVADAEKSLANYDSQVSKEKDADWSKYADAWKKAFEDIQAGRRGSNAVNAALDLFFTPEQILRMRERGLEAADIIADDFWRSIFTYTDENGALQFINDDAGATLAWKLYDDFADEAGNITSKNGDIVASFEEVDGQLSITVDDFNKLSQVMSEKYDISIDPDVLAEMLAALGVYTTRSQETAEGIREIAEAADAVNQSGAIDLEKIIQGQIDAGKTTQDIINLRDNILELAQDADSGITIDVGRGNIDDVKAKVDDLIASRDKVGEEDPSFKVDADTKEAEQKLGMVERWKRNIGQPVETRLEAITTGIQNGINWAKTALIGLGSYFASHPVVLSLVTKTTKSAEGQRNFRGGLSLINEKGAELIVEGDSARIAGEGQPTLTYLQQGADVYTASETKAILGNTDYSYLYDGIGAYAGGRADGITRPTHGGGDNTPDNGNGGTTDNGGYTAPSNNNNNNNTTKPTKDKNSKDEELEKLKEKVELRKAELELLQEQGASVKKQEAKQQEVIDAMKKQLEYMEKHNASKKDRVRLETEILKAEKEQKEFELDRIKGVVELRKSELDLLEQQDASIKKQIGKNRQIYDALGKQLKYMKQIGSSQEEINKVKEEQLKIQEDINKLEKDLMGNLEKAVDGKISRINDLKKKETDAIQKQIDAIKKENEEEKKATEYQEKQLAVEEAKEKLRNARAERTVRYFNAKTGQWEWKADAQAIKSAKDELDQAKKTLNEAKDDARIAKLEAKQERIEAKRDAQIESWQKVLDSFKDPVISIEKAIKTIEKNATKAQKAEIKALNKLLKPLGYQISTKNLYDSGGVLSGMGGIKATANDEVILPPDITKKMLTPMSSAILSNRLSELRYLYGMTGGNLAGITNNSSIGSQHNGDLYTFGNITLTEAQARSTTIYDLVQRSRSLRAYSAM